MSKQTPDELRQQVETQVMAYCTLKGGDPSAETLGAYAAIDNIMSMCDRYYAAAIQKAEQAYGGCHNCYGKGYATVNEYASGGGKKWKVDNIKPCTCDRGKQFAEIKAALHPDTGQDKGEAA